jgi:3-phenylpropionate/trans-cinnamate dioxygenase ferredoxin reductase subunit
MTSDQTHIIVGASLAGAKAAETLREEGFEGRVVLIGAEQERPYERPPLSKDYLRGEVGREKVYVHDEGFYATHDIQLRLGRKAVGLDVAGGELELDDGERLRYGRLLLATGAEPRRIAVPGAGLDGILYLRSVQDSDTLRERLDGGGSVVVVGAGWIGAEVAASARQRGLDVTVLDPLAVPLERVLGTEVGAVYRDLHADHGVRMLMGTGVEAFEGGEHVERVRMTDGRRLDCDFVVVGIGVEPRTRLASEAGLEMDNGIVVDQLLQTSAPGVFAAGDVANARHPLYGEHLPSSTGPMPSTRGRRPPATCSTHRSRTSGCPTSSPTSTTSGWSTRASCAAGTVSSSGVIQRAASSSRSGSSRIASPPE